MAVTGVTHFTWVGCQHDTPTEMKTRLLEIDLNSFLRHSRCFCNCLQWIVVKLGDSMSNCSRVSWNTVNASFIHYSPVVLREVFRRLGSGRGRWQSRTQREEWCTVWSRLDWLGLETCVQNTYNRIKTSSTQRLWRLLCNSCSRIWVGCGRGVTLSLSLSRYRPQQYCGNVMFSQASVCPQGRGRCTPPWADTNSRADTHIPGRHPSSADTPPRRPLRQAVRILVECILVSFSSCDKNVRPWKIHL